MPPIEAVGRTARELRLCGDLRQRCDSLVREARDRRRARAASRSGCGPRTAACSTAWSRPRRSISTAPPCALVRLAGHHRAQALRGGAGRGDRGGDARHLLVQPHGDGEAGQAAPPAADDAVGEPGRPHRRASARSWASSARAWPTRRSPSGLACRTARCATACRRSYARSARAGAPKPSSGRASAASPAPGDR